MYPTKSGNLKLKSAVPCLTSGNQGQLVWVLTLTPGHTSTAAQLTAPQFVSTSSLLTGRELQHQHTPSPACKYVRGRVQYDVRLGWGIWRGAHRGCSSACTWSLTTGVKSSLEYEFHVSIPFFKRFSHFMHWEHCKQSYPHRFARDTIGPSTAARPLDTGLQNWIMMRRGEKINIVLFQRVRSQPK